MGITMVEGYLGSMEMVEISGGSYRQIDYWTRLGHLRTVGPPEPGQGKTRLYPAKEVKVARLLVMLSARGLMDSQWRKEQSFVPELVKRVRRHGLKGSHRFGMVEFHLDGTDG